MVKSAIKNQRLLQALRRQPVDKTPVWLMRQAGRYLPEYRQLRASLPDFLTLCKTPELACEATLQPIRRFPLDAAIIFSDILTVPDAMGLGLYFKNGEGPAFKHPVRDEQSINKLSVPDPEKDLAYVTEAIRLAKRELDNSVPLIGFSGSPWTLATYMVEGGSSKDFSVIKRLLYDRPELLHRLLDKVTEAVIHYLMAQINAGADVVMLFDSWGGTLASDAYLHFSLAYMKRIIQSIKADLQSQSIPIILFTKGGGLWLEAIADSGCEAVGIDWTLDIGIARARVGHKVALQGNLEPAALYGKPSQIQQEVNKIMDRFGNDPGHIFNLGHGMLPDVSPEHVSVLVEAVHNYHRVGIKV